MTREQRWKTHSQIVSAWIQETTSGISKIPLAEYFEKKTARLIKSASTALSEITLAAILDRILDAGPQLHPAIGDLRYEDSQLNFAELIKNIDLYNDEQLRDAFQFFITEFLFIIGNLTGEQMSPLLHKELKATSGPSDSPSVRKKSKKDPS